MKSIEQSLTICQLFVQVKCRKETFFFFLFCVILAFNELEREINNQIKSLFPLFFFMCSNLSA